MVLQFSFVIIILVVAAAAAADDDDAESVAPNNVQCSLVKCFVFILLFVAGIDGQQQLFCNNYVCWCIHCKCKKK